MCKPQFPWKSASRVWIGDHESNMGGNASSRIWQRWCKAPKTRVIRVIPDHLGSLLWEFPPQMSNSTEVYMLFPGHCHHYWYYTGCSCINPFLKLENQTIKKEVKTFPVAEALSEIPGSVLFFFFTGEEGQTRKTYEAAATCRANQIDHLRMKLRGIKEIRRVKRRPTGLSASKTTDSQPSLFGIRLFFTFLWEWEWECGFVWEKPWSGAVWRCAWTGGCSYIHLIKLKHQCTETIMLLWLCVFFLRRSTYVTH